MKKTTPGQWIALSAMALGVFMGLLDVTVVNVALPTMATDLNETFTNLQWVLNAYTLVFAVTLLIMSKLGDMFGRKKIFVASMVIFTLASIMNGMSTSLTMLNIGRGIQAIGGAGMMSLSMALVASNFASKQRGTALGILGSVIGLSSASGPLIGGYLVEHFGWQSIFFINVPVGIISVILSVIFIKETPSFGANQKIDFAGMFLSAAALFTGIYGLIQKEGHYSWGWTDPRVGGWLIAAIILLVLFIIIESKLKNPMMNLKMFKNRHFVGAVLVALALGWGIYSYNAYLTALMQNYIGYSAFDTGVRQLTISVWSLILGPLTGILGARFSNKRLISGSLFIGGIGFLLLANAMTTKVSFVELWPGMVLMGITNGMVNPLLNTAGMEGVAMEEMGMASGLLNVFRQFGTTIGVVSLGLIQSSQYENYLNGHIHSIPATTAVADKIKDALIEAGPFSGHTIAFSDKMNLAPFAHELQQVVLHAYDKGMTAATLLSAGVVFVGAIAAGLLLKKNS